MAEVKIAADSGGGSVGLVGPASTTGNAAIQLKLPVADGSANQHLKTDGSGQLGWVTEGVGGKLLQHVTGTHTGQVSTTSTSPANTGLEATITPASTNSKIMVITSFGVGHQRDYSGQGMGLVIVREVSGSGTDIWKSGTPTLYRFDNGQLVETHWDGQHSNTIIDSPSTTSAVKYYVQFEVYIASNGGTAWFNRNGDSTSTAYIHLLEFSS